MIRNREYQKNLQQIIENLKKENSKFYVGGSCIGKICLIDNCGKDATHKVGEEIFDDEPHKIRHELTNYVCCGHYQMILGEAAEQQCKGLKHDLYYRKIALLSDK
jgi:hypothetical protein